MACENCGGMGRIVCPMCTNPEGRWYQSTTCVRCGGRRWTYCDCGATRVGPPHPFQRESRGCFPGNAKIMTSDGYVLLNSLRVGDVITSWQEDTRTWVNRRVKKIISYGLARVTHLDLSDGTTVRVTDHHTIHTSKGWRKISSLKEQDCITSGRKWREVRVLRIRRTAERVPVYNLHCEGEYNFVADGVIAHSFSTLRVPRVALNRIADRIRALWARRQLGHLECRLCALRKSS
jgi:hypothetical protein